MDYHLCFSRIFKHRRPPDKEKEAMNKLGLDKKLDKKLRSKPVKGPSTGCFGCISRKAVKAPSSGTPTVSPATTPGHVEDLQEKLGFPTTTTITTNTTITTTSANTASTCTVPSSTEITELHPPSQPPEQPLGANTEPSNGSTNSTNPHEHSNSTGAPHPAKTNSINTKNGVLQRSNGASSTPPNHSLPSSASLTRIQSTESSGTPNRAPHLGMTSSASASLHSTSSSTPKHSPFSCPTPPLHEHVQHNPNKCEHRKSAPVELHAIPARCEHRATPPRGDFHTSTPTRMPSLTTSIDTSPLTTNMTAQCIAYNQPGFASVIQSINRELHEKAGHLRGESGDEDSGHPTDDNNTSGNTTSAAAPTTTSTTNAARQMAEYRQLLTEMRAQNFDVIRFATYRTACKLRFIQRKTNLFLVDIWNVIEAFRENGLNSLEPQSEVNTARLESLLNSIFYQLNKRLPTNSQIDSEESVSILSHWLTNAYDPEKHGRLRVLSIKVSLATLCAGKLMDKLRYIFTQVSDTNGFLLKNKFEEYLREVLNLPTAIFEGPSFGFNETAARACFDGKSKVTVNDFLDTLMSDPGPQCLMWLPILHRMAQVENVFHPVQCEGCHRESFMGFRYKCQRCYNYHLCQDCFWRGRVSGNHTNEHEMKEYSSYKSPAKQLTHSLRKSFRCVPAKGNHRLPHFPDTPEKTIDLSHIVPPTPVPVHNGFHETSRAHSIDMSSLDSSSATKSPSKMCGSLDRDASRIDDEHRLIARYAARLAADANDAARSPTELNFNLDSNRAQRELIAQLEAKNKEILREIQRLRIEQEQQAKTTKETQQRNPTLLAELRILRQRRDELEARMSALQESRRELMTQLEGLMKLLKTHGSPRSTPNSSPRSRSAHSPPVQAIRGSTSHSVNSPADALLGTSGDVRQAFGQHPPGSSTSSVRNLRNDLLVAADSVTNAMSSLVKELNSEASGSSEEEGEDIEHTNYRGMDNSPDLLGSF